ncbi:MAG: amidohydrolase family protein [Thermoplasmatota archaeon]
MPLFAGRILLSDRTIEGYLQVEGGRITAMGEGEPEERPDARGWIVPFPVNGHTHAADTFLRSRRPKGASVKELVGPGGWKHQMLAAASDDDHTASFQALAGEMAGLGTSHFIDFREGGVPGARLLRDVADDLPVRPVILGRGAAHGGRFDEDEARELLQVADGIGLSGLRDLPRRDLEAWAEAARDARKPLAIHVSEDQRDDIDLALSLEPTFVVHMVQGTRSDFEELAAARVPVVVCPRSNRAFGLRPPVPLMVQEGVTVALGTDNGMLADGDLLAEAGQLKAWYRDRLSDETLLRMMTHGARALLGLPAWKPKVGGPADAIVLPVRPIAPAATVKPPAPPLDL